MYTEYAILYKYIKINKNERDYDNNVYYVKDDFGITSRRILTYICKRNTGTLCLKIIISRKYP